MSTIKISPMCTVVAGLCIALLCPDASAAGKLIYVNGAVNISTPSEPSRPARVGDELSTGGTISTANGRAYLQFDDGAALSIQPSSIFRMDEYAHGSGRTDSFFASLLKGGLRVVTGLIGKSDSSRFKVNGIVATVGIRGTAFKMELCQDDCESDRPNGLYVDGGEGVTVLTNAAGEILLRRGEFGFAPASGQLPERRNTEGTRFAGISQHRVISRVDGIDRDTPVTSDYTYRSNFQVPLKTIEIKVVAGAYASTPIRGTSYDLTGDVRRVAPNSQEVAYMVVDRNNNLVALASNVNLDNNPNSLTYNLFQSTQKGTAFVSANHVENGGTDGLLYWGRWTKGLIQASGFNSDGSPTYKSYTLSNAESIGYLVATQPSIIPTIGSASYTFFAGTPSTGSDGVLGGGAQGGTLNVNFARNTGDVALQISHGGQLLNQLGTFKLNTADRGGFTSTGDTGSSKNWEFKGFLAGGNATVNAATAANATVGAPLRAGLSYNITQGAGVQVYGVAGFK